MSLPEKDNMLFPAYAWPGGYPLAYVDRHNSILCPNCANKDLEEPAVDAFIHWEGEPLSCDECSDEIESAYGVPESEEDEEAEE